ncbi:hypothetical protein [Streptomyces thermoalcalitolerans]|uniref:Transposase n=1 Tax=Streptomyces thermoalcalitolerans TaxID=65605 RepID=A0ABP3YXA9_9ACTN
MLLPGQPVPRIRAVEALRVRQGVLGNLHGCRAGPATWRTTRSLTREQLIAHIQRWEAELARLKDNHG